MHYYLTKFFWLPISLIILGVDRFSKWLVIFNYNGVDSLTLLPVLNLSLVFNRGAAFGLWGRSGPWARWLLIIITSIISFLIILWQFKSSKSSCWVSAAMALILGGALGNLWDRICYGAVIDFIQFHLGDWYYPTFNLADVAIFLGAMLLITEILTTREK